MSLERKPDGTLVLSREVSLPEILDVLIVGGGPAGTAAAFRARELERSALVVDMDDILSRIRDYAKAKPILPGYGRGDRMKFPLGGELFNALHFEPIDKDAMHEKWKRYYHDFAIPARTGVELVGLDRDEGRGLWAATLKNANLRREETVLARAVILAVGRGVPRRFDIPGDLDNLAFRFTDASLYLDGPACVIGGGTSAAEAVIAISNAKLAGGATGDVYWSYRGTKLPKVSAALAEPFFEAFVGNGNVRYFRLSEPQAVVVGDDKQEYLSIRVDRRSVEGGPAETTHLEFPVRRCVACIGEDIPVGLLASMGIHLQVGGRRKTRRLTVSPILETHRKNLLLIGDTLSDSYMETEDFKADPKTYRDQGRPGNIKMALRDGLVAMEVVHQRLEGKADIEVAVRWAKERPEDKTQAPFVVRMGGRPGDGDRSTMIPVPGAGGKAGTPSAQPDIITPPGAPRPMTVSPPAYLVRVLPGNVEEDEYELGMGERATIGSAGATISAPDDSHLADLHAGVFRGEDTITLTDAGSEGGVFLRLRPGEETEVPSGTVLRAGRQFVRFGREGARGEFEHFDAAGASRGRHELAAEHRFAGRKDADIVLDGSDGTLSRRHFSAAVRGDSFVVTDHFASNGTWRRIEGPVALEDGDEFRAGRQTFRLRTEASGGGDLAAESGAGDASRLVARAAPAVPAPAAAGAVTVTFAGTDDPFEADEGMSVLEVAQDNEIPIEYECQGGSCGFDPIRVLEGMENLEPAGEIESKYLKEKGHGPDCRFACMSFLSGPVKVEILKR